MVELGEVFRRYGPAYLDKFGAKMPTRHLRAMRAIARCRTPALGGHIYYCLECDESLYRYHSCRNRHCPTCQNDKAYRWLEKQQDLLLPVPYFLLTVTLPSELRAVARSHPALIYDLLFRASAAAIQSLGQDSRFVGGQMGLVGVLHTWGRDMSYHPHIHYLIPAGGLAVDEQVWLPARTNFLLPVKALSKIIRAKFRDALRQTDCFSRIPADTWQRDWVVHCKPVGNGQLAVKYLAPYILRVAISNNRIVEAEDGTVTFSYRPSGTGQTKSCTLEAFEFIRRFLQHILPKHFVKVRYYGFFGPACRQRLACLRQQLSSSPTDTPPSPASTDLPHQATADMPNTRSEKDHPPPIPAHNVVVRCPSCGQPMRRRLTIRPLERSPPWNLPAAHNLLGLEHS
jgi:hypothetical protein